MISKRIFDISFMFCDKMTYDELTNRSNRYKTLRKLIIGILHSLFITFSCGNFLNSLTLQLQKRSEFIIAHNNNDWGIYVNKYVCVDDLQLPITLSLIITVLDGRDLLTSSRNNNHFSVVFCISILETCVVNSFLMHRSQLRIRTDRIVYCYFDLCP